MKATEFRLANLAKDNLTNELLICCELGCDTDGRNTKITFALLDENKYPLPNGWKAEPIPLTEEWLLKFGLRKEKTKPPTKQHGSYFSIWVMDYKYSFSYADFRDDWGLYYSCTDACDEKDNNKFDFISCGTKYVHQLQNLYFALTGEELTIKS